MNPQSDEATLRDELYVHESAGYARFHGRYPQWTLSPSEAAAMTKSKLNAMNTPDTCPYCHAIISDTGHFCPGPDNESISWSKTKADTTPPTTKELVEKLEEWLGQGEEWLHELPHTAKATVLLQECLAELKRGEEDTRRLDYIQETGHHIEMFDGLWSVVTDTELGCIGDKQDVREAIDAAMSSTAAKEGEG